MSSRIFFLFLVAISFSACAGEDFFEATVDIETPPHKPALAVTANFAAGDTTLRIYLTHSLDILSQTDAEPIPDADVEIFKDGTSLGKALYFSDKLYKLPLVQALPAEMATYELKISAPGFDPVQASQVMPPPVPIISATFEIDGAIDDDGERVDELTIEFEDPAGVENYYSVFAYVVFDDQYTEEFSLGSLDPITEEGMDDYLLKDVTFDGKRYEWRLKAYRFFELTDDVKMYVVLRSITADQYFFSRSVSLSYDTDDNPFAEPVIIHNNIEGGYGIFSLESRDVKEVEF
ncbi:MAG: DUF4249 domain-containing protein [Bacteroidetes bacterium]|nr:MAG: DUF4249 domain-containing protein [Bacteroidota bacterium]